MKKPSNPARFKVSNKLTKAQCAIVAKLDSTATISAPSIATSKAISFKDQPIYDPKRNLVARRGLAQ